MQQDSTSLIQEIIEVPAIGEKVEPRGIIAAAISILSAGLIGLGGAIAMELRDRSVRSPAEFEEILESKIIGHIPSFESDSELSELIASKAKTKSRFRPSLVCFHAPNSRSSEGLRALRTQVLFRLGGDGKILGITSANSGAGKSTVASNLAVSLSQAGKNVLLVDCDMRLPQVHEIFGLSNENGLAKLIETKCDPSELIIKDELPNLFILPAGLSHANPAELLGSDTFRNFVESARKKYDYVVLDCPPVLPVSDPTILAPLTNGLLFVSVVNQESRPETSNAKRSSTVSVRTSLESLSIEARQQRATDTVLMVMKALMV